VEIITANTLSDGRVVFQTAFGWTFHIDEAALLNTEQETAAALARAEIDAAENRVVEPYAIAVSRSHDEVTPVRLRERIRALGPSVGNSKRSAPENGAGRG
jgi:hypothetical protein